MAATVQNTYDGRSTSGVTALNVSVTVGAGTNLGLVVLVASNDQPRSVVFGTQVLNLRSTGFSGAWQISAYELPEPTVGTADVVVTLPNSANVTVGCYVLTEYGGIRTFQAVVSGTSTAPTITVTSATGDLVLDIVASDAASQTFAVGASQTSLYAQDSLSGTAYRSAGSSEPGAATNTMSWTLGVSDHWGMGGVSIYDDDTANDLRIAATRVQALQASIPVDLRIAAHRVQVLQNAVPTEMWIAAHRVQVLVQVDTSLPVDGTVPAGTNPPAANIPSTTPQFFGVLEEPSDGTILEAHAEAAGGPFANNADYYGGFQERRILNFGRLTRRATTPAGGIQVTTHTVTFDDTDRHFSGSWPGTKRRDKKWSTYVIEHADRLAKLEAWRLGAGLVTDHAPGDDFTYTFTVQGMLGRHIARQNGGKSGEAMAPPSRLTATELPALAARWSDGFSPPVGYGFLSDETAAKPQGVVPGIYAGTTNLQNIYGGGAINIEADFYIFFGHAVQDTLNLYYTPPGWTSATAYRVGDVIRPNLASNGFLYKCTVAGTSGGSAPTFSLTPGATFGDGGVTWQNFAVDDPDLRFAVPADAYGQIVADPHKPNWTAVTGSTDKFTDWNGHRLHVVLVRNDHPFAKALRENRMTLSGNFRGIEDVGDTTGALITAPSRIFQHFWTNFVENHWVNGAWFPVSTFGTYSLFDTDTVEAVHAVTDTLVSGGPVQAGMLIGHRGQQVTVFEVVKRMATSWDLKFTENRHGQIVTLIDVSSAPAAVTFTQQDDAIRFTTAPRRAGYANVIRYRYGPRHVPPVATQLEGEQGQPMPATNFQEHAEWMSGLQTLSNATAIAQNDGTEEYLDLDLWGVRDQATADMYAARALARAVGPTGSLEGAVAGVLTTGLQGLKVGSTAIDVGTMMGNTHIQGLGASGYVDAKFIIDETAIEPDTCLVTHSGELQA